jgi:hypothetical protein
MGSAKATPQSPSSGISGIGDIGNMGGMGEGFWRQAAADLLAVLGSSPGGLSLGARIGFVPPPATFLFVLAGMVALYLLIVQAAKSWFYHHYQTA